MIIPETTLNAGWCDIAHKMEEFIKCPKKQEVAGLPRLTDVNYPYAEAVKVSKWYPKKTGDTKVRRDNGVIEISAKPRAEETGMLNRFWLGAWKMKARRDLH